MVGDDGSLGNVFVYVKEGRGNRSFPTPSEPFTFDQRAAATGRTSSASRSARRSSS